MISSPLLINIKQAFSRYVDSFTLITDAQREAFSLKTAHTMRVCEVIRDLAQSLKFTEPDTDLAQITGLLHDIGRFEQYMRYNTFADKESENHGQLGSRVASKTGIIDSLDNESQSVVLRAVENHNLFAIDPAIAGKELLFSQLVRDADKIDIFNICAEYYHRSEKSPHKVIEVGLPDLPQINDSVIEACCAGTIASSRDIATLNDFKVLQLSWVYDLHFLRSFEVIREKKHIDLIASTLPQNKKTRRCLDVVVRYVNDHCGA